MKKILLIAMLLVSASSFAQIRSASLTASGLTCSMCSKAIYKALQKVPFIRTVDVDISKSSYALTFKPGAAVVLDDIKKAVEEAGFSVASMSVTATFNGDEVYNDAHLTVAGTALHFVGVKKQTLTGDRTFTIVDKAYLPAAARKKYGRFTTMACFETGTMAACCARDGAKGGRIYHVTM